MGKNKITVLLKGFGKPFIYSNGDIIFIGGNDTSVIAVGEDRIPEKEGLSFKDFNGFCQLYNKITLYPTPNIEYMQIERKKGVKPNRKSMKCCICYSEELGKCSDIEDSDERFEALNDFFMKIQEIVYKETKIEMLKKWRKIRGFD